VSQRKKGNDAATEKTPRKKKKTASLSEPDELQPRRNGVFKGVGNQPIHKDNKEKREIY